jgi:hypothetical protein
MELSLEGKVVLVTGGSKGIGFAWASAFAADLGDAAAAGAMIDAVESGVGPVDVLVNSAGAARRTSPDKPTPSAWRAAFDAKFFSYVNVNVNVNVIDPVVKRVAARGGGVIVTVIGDGGKVASPTHLAGGAGPKRGADARDRGARRGLCRQRRSGGRRQSRHDRDRPRGGTAHRRCAACQDLCQGGAPAQRRADSDRPNGVAARDRRRRVVPDVAQGGLRHRGDPIGRRRPESVRCLSGEGRSIRHDLLLTGRRR